MHTGRWIARAIALSVAAALIAPAAAGAATTGSKDKAILKAGVITASDVPSTWVATKASDNSDKEFGGIAACKPIQASSAAVKKTVPHALSRQYNDPSSPSGTTGAANRVYAFKNSAAATKYLAAYQSSSATTCVTQFFQRVVGQGGQATVTSIANQLQGLGDGNVGYEAALTATPQGGQPTSFTADIIGVQVGRAFVFFTFLASGTQQIAQGQTIVKSVIGRVTATPQ